MGKFIINSRDNKPPKPGIVWHEGGTTEEKFGAARSINIKIESIEDPDNDSITSIYQINRGNGFIDMHNVVAEDIIPIDLEEGLNQIRVKSVDTYGNIGYSNILIFNHTAPVYSNLSITKKVYCDTLNENRASNDILFSAIGVDNKITLGYNYKGFKPVSLTILSYSDITTYDDVEKYNMQSALVNGETSERIEFPHTIDLNSDSNVLNIKQLTKGPDLICENDSIAKREIKIVYKITDIYNTQGAEKYYEEVITMQEPT